MRLAPRVAGHSATGISVVQSLSRGSSRNYIPDARGYEGKKRRQKRRFQKRFHESFPFPADGLRLAAQASQF
jgi:hypothetical protein